jgi:hypothetical protein
MICFLSSPVTQLQAHVCKGQNVLLSYPLFKNRPSLIRDYAPSFSRILIDSGAYSSMNSGTEIVLSEYAEWCDKIHWADAFAGLDDIKDWRKSMKNYQAWERGFPTYHDGDPPELLDELIPMARERGGWIGLGLAPPRHGKSRWVSETLQRIPHDLWVHGWALQIYTALPGRRKIDSVDSTTWYRRSEALRVNGLQFLTPAEALEIEILRIERRPKRQVDESELPLFQAEGSKL